MARSRSASGACSTSNPVRWSPERDRPHPRWPRRRRSPGPTTACRTARGGIDLGGLTVLPGLIDTHSHLIGEVQTAGVPATTTSAAQDALLGVVHARDTVEAGFTSVRDLGPFRAFVDLALRDAINAGDVEGPRMQGAGAFITAPWGGGDVVGLAHDIRLPEDLRFGVVTSPAEVRERVRRLLIGGADLIKCIGTGAVLTRGGVPGAPELSEDELRTAVEEAGYYGEVRRGPRALVRGRQAGDPGRGPVRGARVDDRRRGDRDAGGHGHLLRGRPVRRRVGARGGRGQGWPAETMAKLARDDGDGHRGHPRAVERGVRIVYGTDSGVYPHALVAKQFAWYVRCGMTPLAAIRSATVVAAECMGWSDRVGTLAPGRFADLVAVDGDPLADVAGARAAGGRAEGRPASCSIAGPAERADVHAARHRPPGRRRPRPDAAAARSRRDLGMAFTGGGRHEAWGTYNRLAFLGDTYVELIGVFDRALVTTAPGGGEPGGARATWTRAARAWRRTRWRPTTSAARSTLRAEGSPIARRSRAPGRVRTARRCAGRRPRGELGPSGRRS